MLILSLVVIAALVIYAVSLGGDEFKGPKPRTPDEIRGEQTRRF